jgi:hypothetical protein
VVESAARKLEEARVQPVAQKVTKTDQQLAGSADRNSCRSLHYPQAEHRILNKTFSSSEMPLQLPSSHWRMLLNLKATGQHANAP